MSLRLANSTSWDLAEVNAWIQSAQGQIICLEIAIGSEGAISVLGNIRQKDFQRVIITIEFKTRLDSRNHLAASVIWIALRLQVFAIKTWSCLQPGLWVAAAAVVELADIRRLLLWRLGRGA